VIQSFRAVSEAGGCEAGTSSLGRCETEAPLDRNHCMIKPLNGSPMHEFIVLVIKAPTCSYLAVFPDLPECIAFSETFEGIGAAATAALGVLLEEMMRMGWPIPSPSSIEAIDADPQNSDRLASLSIAWRGYA
jgi:predicted RNase H-like HicB family nuclease